METAETSYYLATLRKIREGLVNNLKHSKLEIGIDYRLSKATDSFIFDLIINETGLNFSDYKLILEKSNNQISASKIGPRLIRINVEKVYEEMTKDLKIESSKFKDTLLDFIEKNTNLKPKEKNYHGDFKVTDYSFNPKKLVLIGCEDKYHFDKIIKVLEKDDYYFKRTSIIDGQLHLQIEESENSNIVKKISFVKNFFEKLERLCSKDEYLFKVKTLITVIINRMEKIDPIKIVLKFAKSDFIDNFINRIPPNWDNDIVDLTTVEIFLTKEDMEKFVSSNNSPPPIKEDKFISISRFEMSNNKVSSNKEEAFKQLGYLNPDLSFLDETTKEEIPKPQKFVSIKTATKEPIQKHFYSKKIPIMKKTEMTEMSDKRKNFANHFILGLQTRFTGFASKIKMETGRFTSTAKGFEISVPKEKEIMIKDDLEEKGTNFTRSENGNFIIMYSDDYLPKDNKPRSLIILCDKERKNVLRTLANENFNQKKGGRGKKMGVFTMNQSASMASTMVLILRILNKNAGTLSQVLKIVRDYYAKHEKKSLVEIKPDTDNSEIQIKFKPDFFVAENKMELKEIPQSPVEHIEQTQETELEILTSMATEEDTLILAEIDKLQTKRVENKKEFLTSVSGLLVESFWKILGEKNIKLFVQKDEDGLLTLSQLSSIEIKKAVSLEVLEKLKLTK